MKQKPVIAATLAINEVATRIQLARIRPIEAAEGEALAKQLLDALGVLQRTIGAAVKILEEGPPE